ncbi:MAG: hypothetical protein N2560_09805, partial [Ignavibacteria bacterium]|nr:hypothetical protein [Ignavibacteria bacterium]
MFIKTFFSFICSCFVVFSQTWREAQDSVSYYFSQNDFPKAFAWAEKEFSAAQREFSQTHPNYLLSLRHIFVINSNLQVKKDITPYLKIVEKLVDIEPEGNLYTKYVFYSELSILLNVIGNSQLIERTNF